LIGIAVQDGLIGIASAQQPVELADAVLIEANDFAVDEGSGAISDAISNAELILERIDARLPA